MNCCLFFRLDDKQSFMELNDETVYYYCQSYQADYDDDDDGNHETHHVETRHYYGANANAAKTMPAWTILPLSKFMHELSRLRERRPRLAAVRSGPKLEYREKYVRLGFQESMHRETS